LVQLRKVGVYDSMTQLVQSSLSFFRAYFKQQVIPKSWHWPVSQNLPVSSYEVNPENYQQGHP